MPLWCGAFYFAPGPVLRFICGSLCGSFWPAWLKHDFCFTWCFLSVRSHFTRPGGPMQGWGFSFGSSFARRFKFCSRNKFRPQKDFSRFIFCSPLQRVRGDPCGSLPFLGVPSGFNESGVIHAAMSPCPVCPGGTCPFPLPGNALCVLLWRLGSVYLGISPLAHIVI